MNHQEIAALVLKRGGCCDCCQMSYKDPGSAVMAHSRNGNENPLVCRVCKQILDQLSRLNSLNAALNVMAFYRRQIEGVTGGGESRG